MSNTESTHLKQFYLETYGEYSLAEFERLTPEQKEEIKNTIAFASWNFTRTTVEAGRAFLGKDKTGEK